MKKVKLLKVLKCVTITEDKELEKWNVKGPSMLVYVLCKMCFGRKNSVDGPPPKNTCSLTRKHFISTCDCMIEAPMVVSSGSMPVGYRRYLLIDESHLKQLVIVQCYKIIF